MVRSLSFSAILIVAFFLLSSFGAIDAQAREYHFDQEWAKIWINQDGSIDLFYNISITLDSGSEIHYISVGQPKGDFSIGAATDQYNNTLMTSDASSGSDYKAQVNLTPPLEAGQTIWFTITTNVAHMIMEDTQNPGNVGMQFKPTWWSEAEVTDLRVSVVLPPNVTTENVKTLVDWDSTSMESGQLVIFWERQNLPPDQQYTFGLSFPKEYVQTYGTQPSGVLVFFSNYGFWLAVGAFFVGLVVIIIVVASKSPYSTPSISMETLGVRRGLTAVEASCLLDLTPPKIVTEILYSLLQKRAIWVESTTPSLKLKIMKPFEGKTGTRETPLRYYEIDFLNAVKEDGMLDEEKLAHTIMRLRDNLEEKTRGYCRRDTIAYYESIVKKAWEQVEQAGTPGLASNAYNEQLLWLMLDPEYQSRTQTSFRDRVFEPSPMWLWFWYGYQHYYPHPTYKPNVETPTQGGQPPVIPGSDFANNVTAALTNTSNNIVANLEKFANSILPVPAGGRASHEPAHSDATCVCACAACACACACVSCACACAGGGVG
ncbi:hypothetical protein MUP01_03290 [Candidatus Bathyarchaeota archaeon]|nr:hypothetical protein [Candidatus Bathyarchaeota archaeon]